MSVVERLRELSDSEQPRWFSFRAEEAQVLLSAVEAAKDLRENANMVSQGTARHRFLIHQVVWSAFCDSVDALVQRSQEDSEAEEVRGG